MEQQNNDKLKARILELLSLMGFEAELFERAEEGRTVYNIKTRDAQLLIGKQGSTLEALQHIVRVLSRNDGMEDTFSFALDVDDYKDKRTLYLKDLARKAAARVRDTRKPVSLVPMPAYERRIIHNYLSLYKDIKSESTGRDPERKLIIRPLSVSGGASPSPKTKSPKAKDDFNFIENS